MPIKVWQTVFDSNYFSANRHGGLDTFGKMFRDKIAKGIVTIIWGELIGHV